MGYALKYDWEAIKADYVQGWWQTDEETLIRKIYYPTYNDLCNKYGCNLDYLEGIARKDKWRFERQVFQAKVNEQIKEQRVNLFLSESAQVDAHVLDQAKEYLKIIRRETRNTLIMQKAWEIENGLADLDPNDTDVAAVLKSREDEEGNPVGKPLPQVKAQDILTWIKTLAEVQVVARRACNEPVNPDNSQYQQIVDSFRSQNNPKDSIAIKNKIASLEKRRLEIKKKQRDAAKGKEQNWEEKSKLPSPVVEKDNND